MLKRSSFCGKNARLKQLKHIYTTMFFVLIFACHHFLKIRIEQKLRSQCYNVYTYTYTISGMCPRWSAVVGIGHHSKVADHHSSPPTTSRPGANVLQDLPIILFCTASKYFLLFSFFLQLFPLIFSITVHVSWT